MLSHQASSLSQLTQLRSLKLHFYTDAGSRSPARVGLAGLPDTLRSLTLSANDALMIASLPAGAPTEVLMLEGRVRVWVRARFWVRDLGKIIEVHH